MRKIALAFSLYLLVISFTQAQEDYLTLRGRVTDRDTREGLPAVTVCVAGQAIYTQTNNDGEYVLKVPAEHRDGSVVYALMGYLRTPSPLPMHNVSPTWLLPPTADVG